MAFSASHIPDQPCINCPKQKLATFSSSAYTGDVVKNPFYLRIGEVRSYYKTGMVFHVLLPFIRFEFLTIGCGPHVLPYDRIIVWLSCFLIPCNGSLPLICNANGFNVRRRNITFRNNAV